MRLAPLLLIAAALAAPGATGADGRSADPISPVSQFSVAKSEGDDCARLALLENACAPLAEVLGERVLERLDVEAEPDSSEPSDRKRTSVSYQLNDSWRAGLSYRHSLLFGLAQGEKLRGAPFTDFATDRERDILNLQLSWQLRWTFLDFGYRFDSPRAAPGTAPGLSLDRFWPEEGHRTHSLMLGVRREWGGD